MGCDVSQQVAVCCRGWQCAAHYTTLQTPYATSFVSPGHETKLVMCSVMQCCSLLQCFAVCCSVLQCVVVCCICVAVCCSEVQCVAVCCSVLQCVTLCCICVAVCCSVLQCVTVCCSVLQCVAVCCSVLQCVAVCCSVCAAVCCSMLQHFEVCCSVLQCRATGWRKPIGCLIIIGHFPQKSPIISSSYSKKDLQLRHEMSLCHPISQFVTRDLYVCVFGDERGICVPVVLSCMNT